MDESIKRAFAKMQDTRAALDAVSEQWEAAYDALPAESPKWTPMSAANFKEATHASDAAKGVHFEAWMDFCAAVKAATGSASPATAERIHDALSGGDELRAAGWSDGRIAALIA